jgi:Ca2+-binding EF-hand superfamily protein
MLSAVRERKMTRMFQVYDVNRDGKLQADDFAAVGNSIAEQRGYPPGSAPQRALSAKYSDFWGRLSGQNGGKSSMSLAEFLAIMDAQLASRATFEATVDDLGGAAFQVLDIDRDGKITIDEYRAFLIAHKIDPKLADAAFPKLDANGDGHLSEPEVLAIVKEFFYSDDAAAPGNLFYASF